MSLNGKMGKAHELFLAKMLGGRKTKASGSQWTDQMDGRHDRMRSLFAFAWDGKSTLGKSIGVSRAMWEKAREQALGERPMLALRFYDTENLDVGEDLVVLGLHDFVELLEQANASTPLTHAEIYVPLMEEYRRRIMMQIFASPEEHVSAMATAVMLQQGRR